MIKQRMRRGLTIYAGKKGFGKRGKKRQCELISTVITRLRISRMINEVGRIGSKHLLLNKTSKTLVEGIVKKRPLK